MRELFLLDGDAEDGGWQERALCAQTDPEAFFPEKGGSTREAKKVCLTCDVRTDCLESALEKDERFGIWGGLSERERREAQEARRLTSSGDPPAATGVTRTTGTARGAGRGRSPNRRLGQPR